MINGTNNRVCTDKQPGFGYWFRTTAKASQRLKKFSKSALPAGKKATRETLKEGTDLRSRFIQAWEKHNDNRAMQESHSGAADILDIRPVNGKSMAVEASRHGKIVTVTVKKKNVERVFAKLQKSLAEALNAGSLH